MDYYMTWYRKNKKRKREYYKAYANTHPWAKTLRGIEKRVRNPKAVGYKYYKNMKLTLNVSDLKKLWFRDKAYLMERPNIHRKDNKKGYFYSNCKYIDKQKHILVHKKLRRLANPGR